MMASSGCLIRPFDGSPADAQGLLTVERATFDESPYDAEQVRAMLAGGPQRAWVAVQGGTVAGFVIAFLTTGRRGPSWEIDLLAVHPDRRGRGLGSRLIQAASAYGAALAPRARAVVADDNDASARSFMRVGFRAATGTCELLIYRPQEQDPAGQPAPAGLPLPAGVAVREQLDPAAGPGGGPHASLLLAEQDGRQAGQAELIEVQTLLYRGVWIESLRASSPAVRRALVRHAMHRATASGLDELGAMVPDDNRPLQKTLLALEFRSLGKFRWLTAVLPLPPAAGSSHD